MSSESSAAYVDLLAAAKRVTCAYTAEAEDWNDGEFALWQKDDLVVALVELRKLARACETKPDRARRRSEGGGFCMADSLMKRLERDGLDVARRFLIERDGGPELKIGEGQLRYLRGELAGLSRAAWYITGERIEDVEARWIAEASLHFTVPEASRV